MKVARVRCRLTRLLLAGSCALAGFGVAAEAAVAKGLVGGVNGDIAMAGSPYRYTALWPHHRPDGITIVLRTERRTGRVSRWWRLSGPFQIPPLSYDGSTGGLSADGSTLVLSRYSRTYPPRSTRLAILDTQTPIRPPGGQRHPDPVTRVSLPGEFTVNAISPDGATVYLTEHLSRRVGGPFRIKALGQGGELLPSSIGATSGPDGRMAGAPIGRETSRSGRWSYTLYGGYVWRDGTAVLRNAFMLALDTVARRIVRIDLPQLDRHNPFMLDLRSLDGGRRLAVLNGSPGSESTRRLLTVDAIDLTVSQSEPGGAPIGGVGTVLWTLIVVLDIALGIAFALLLRGRRGTSGGDEQSQHA